MDLSSVFPSSDNLYKFLFMGGIFMIAFSFIYPLEKRQKIEIEISLINKQIELLNQEINSLNKSVDALKIQTNIALEDLKKQNLEKDEIKAKQRISEIKDAYNKSFYETKAKESEVITKDIIIKYEKQKIELLKNHVSSFSIFRWLFLIVGAFFTLFGLWNWNKSTKVSSELLKLELQKKRSEQNSPPLPSPPDAPR